MTYVQGDSGMVLEIPRQPEASKHKCVAGIPPLPQGALQDHLQWSYKTTAYQDEDRVKEPNTPTTGISSASGISLRLNILSSGVGGLL